MSARFVWGRNAHASGYNGSLAKEGCIAVANTGWFLSTLTTDSFKLQLMKLVFNPNGEQFPIELFSNEN